jgi:hypothetical protein
MFNLEKGGFQKRGPESKKTIREQPKEIKDARSFKELFDILKKKGGLTGSDGTFYSAEELIRRIGKIRRGEETDLAILTRSEGFREKAAELLERESKIKTSLKEVKEILQNAEKRLWGVGGGDAFSPSREVAKLLRSTLDALKQYPENEMSYLISRFEIDKIIEDIKRVFLRGQSKISPELLEIITEFSQIK